MTRGIRRLPRGTVAGARYALLGSLFVLVVTAYYPFAWDPPRIVHNQVSRSADGTLRFGEMNRARTDRVPDWLPAARRSGDLRVDLEVDPALGQARSAASILMLASDFWHTDLAIGEDDTELLVWLRRPGSNANGDPSFAVREALRPGHWNRIGVRLGGGSIRVDVDGTPELTEPLPPDSLKDWGSGQVALGGEVHGGGSWQGTIRRADVRTPGHVVDYVRTGALSIPGRFLYLPDHVEPFGPPDGDDWVVLPLQLLSFVVVGLLVVWSRRPPIHPARATLAGASLALAIAIGKFLFDGRHTAVIDLVVQVVGALLGALLAWAWARQLILQGPESPGAPE